MKYYIQFNRHVRNVEANTSEDAQKKASEELLDAVLRASDEGGDPVEALLKAGFGVSVRYDYD